MPFHIGELVESEVAFSGIGKLVSLDELTDVGTVAFFESPIRSMCRPIDVRLNDLQAAVIFDEANVYCVDEITGIWRRARYGSQRPNGDHLVLFKRDDTAVISIDEIYVLNIANGSSLNPLEFLEARCTDTPFFTDWRVPFVRAYIEQRAACKSISSILSSSVEIEPHQIAVVRRILQDDTKKYLLADEVGLGKTIEACLVLREHVLQDEEAAFILVAVPNGLINQWRSELIERFYLGDLLDKKIFVCSHEKCSGALDLMKPTMIVIDEAHLIAPWALSEVLEQRTEFEKIAKACAFADTSLLLSGTPLSGNEENFLAMLHLLAPESYSLTKVGKQEFLKLLEERELLGGMYQALVPANDNDTLTEIVKEISTLFPSDTELRSLADSILPLVDWTVPEEGEDRLVAIANMRAYIGENYRLHQRMLRNRREDSRIASLFPGLSGASKRSWEIDEQFLSIDQTLNAFRDEFCGQNVQSTLITSENFIVWLELYLISPMMVGERAKQLLKNEKFNLKEFEVELLEDLVYCGETEQIAKDKQLVEFLLQYLIEHKKGRVVIFCGEQELANHVFDYLSLDLDDKVERHNPNVTAKFCEESVVRVLVCDERGEDGLNLHGGEKYVIHYSVPLSFARIEQRNGRVNRYSAAIYARPIPCTVLVPNRPGIFAMWVDILIETVGIFNHSVASLQYVLQECINDAWQRVFAEGLQPLRDLQEELAGSDGILEKERRRVKAQEELNSMDEEVARAVSFASALEVADEAAEIQAKRMFNWIQRGLQFEQMRGEVSGSFRFRYNNAGVHRRRTLLDVISFVNKCITGIDKESSDWSAPVTSLMSPDRQLVSHGQQIYPMRYGQPFVDTIYNLSRTDTRGTCSMRLRAVNGLKFEEPRIFLNCFWLISNCEQGCHPRIQRLADDQYSPQICSHWLDESGELILDERLQAILDAPYRKEATIVLGETRYQDINVSHSTWTHLEDHFPKSGWTQMVRRISEESLATVKAGVLQESSAVSLELKYNLEAVSGVILIRS